MKGWYAVEVVLAGALVALGVWIMLLVAGCETGHEWKGQRVITYSMFGVTYMENAESIRTGAVQPDNSKSTK